MQLHKINEVHKINEENKGFKTTEKEEEPSSDDDFEWI